MEAFQHTDLSLLGERGVAKGELSVLSSGSFADRQQMWMPTKQDSSDVQTSKLSEGTEKNPQQVGHSSRTFRSDESRRRTLTTNRASSKGGDSVLHRKSLEMRPRRPVDVSKSVRSMPAPTARDTRAACKDSNRSAKMTPNDPIQASLPGKNTLSARYDVGVDSKGRTPLHRACETGILKEVRICCDRAPKDLDHRDSLGLTPFHTAVINGHDEIVDYLLEKGAEVDNENGFGDTPLITAGINGYTKVVRLLLKHGANPLLTDAMSLKAIDALMEGGPNYGEIRTLLTEAENHITEANSIIQPAQVHLEISEPSSMFITSTISEDRSGDYESEMSRRLAPLAQKY